MPDYLILYYLDTIFLGMLETQMQSRWILQFNSIFFIYIFFILFRLIKQNKGDFDFEFDLVIFLCTTRFFLLCAPNH